MSLDVNSDAPFLIKGSHSLWILNMELDFTFVNQAVHFPDHKGSGPHGMLTAKY